MSGVTAVVLASVILAGRPARIGQAANRIQVHATYETVVFLLESVIFGVIGLQLPTLVRSVSSGSWSWAGQAAILAATLLAVRALWVFPLWLATRRRAGGNPSWRVPAVVSWAGARGVLPLTAALSIPLVTDAGDALPGRDRVLLLTTAVIAITLVIQGASLGPMVRRAGVAVGTDDARDETRLAQTVMTNAAPSYLDSCDANDDITAAELAQLRSSLRLPDPDAAADVQDGVLTQRRRLRQDLIAGQSAELARLYESGEITAVTRRELQRRLDLEHASLDS